MATMRTKAGVAHLLLLAPVLAACAPPPTAPALTPAAFPFQVDSLRTQPVREGMNHYFIYSPTGPWAINVLDIRLDRCFAPVAVKGGMSAVGRAKTSDLLRQLDVTRDVVGGVNADFFLFTPPGVPTGAHVSAGRVITPPAQQPVFAVDSAGMPHIVTLSLRTAIDSLVADDPRLATAILDPFHPLEAVGGRPEIARDSVILAAAVDAGTPTGFARARHPRTAVGIAASGRRVVLAVVDGRQTPYSAGMSLRELAVLMLALGTPDALNLDGGGSTTLVFADPRAAHSLRVANRPSDATGERAVGNALAIVRECPPR